MNHIQALEIKLFRKLKLGYNCYTITLAEMNIADNTAMFAATVERSDGGDPEHILYLECVHVPDDDDVRLPDIVCLSNDYDDEIPERIISRYIRDRTKATEYAKHLQTRLTGYAEGSLDELGRLDWTWKDITNT